jgi:hypothetical protein
VNGNTIFSIIVDINISRIAFADMNCWARERVVYSEHVLAATRPFKNQNIHLSAATTMYI